MHSKLQRRYFILSDLYCHFVIYFSFDHQMWFLAVTLSAHDSSLIYIYICIDYTFYSCNWFFFHDAMYCFDDPCLPRCVKCMDPSAWFMLSMNFNTIDMNVFNSASKLVIHQDNFIFFILKGKFVLCTISVFLRHFLILRTCRKCSWCMMMLCFV